MQSLLGGADCSTSSNPLKQVLQREGVDNSIFRDRLGASSGAGSSSQVPFRPFQAPVAQSHSPLHVNPTPHPFNLSHLSSALAESSRHASPAPHPSHFNAQWDRAASQPAPQHLQQQMTRPPVPMSMPQQPGFAGDFSRWNGGGATGTTSGSEWANGYTDWKGKGRAPPPLPLAPAPQDFAQSEWNQPRPFMPMQSSFQPMYSGALPGPMTQQMPVTDHQAAAQRSAREQADMEAAFERALEDARAERATDEEEQTKEEAVPAEENREAKGDFEKVWESLKPQAERLNQLAEWEKDFSQFTNDEDDLFDVLNESLNRDDVGQASLDEQLHLETGVRPDLEGFLDSDDGLPRPRPYEFASSAPSPNLSVTAAWAEANRLLSTGGSLSEATSLLETFLQRATPEDYHAVQATDVEAWSLLGRTHAMNEKEEKALSAFQQGQRALEGEDAGREKAAGEMLTNLAISYVNESLDLAALTTLHQFLRIAHPSQAGPAPSRSALTETSSPWALHQGVTNSYLNLAREQYASNGTVDPDVQVGLGTLYYMMGEYGEARDCWVAALGERPDDYLLWNRLGATLANGGNPEEAVDAYRRALELRPTFTRAIFNLGVACLNIGVHREAAEHFLAALSLHPHTGTEGAFESSALWSTLRRALVALDLPQLADQAKPGTDLGVFHQAGFEF
ncbi:hypothetical protein JCM24511_08409 [Saitozyma sp. JCM 24511]|nr:hypothetical protein JCM24511_08409 [Saitozyma sp. JCM 24511]